MEKIGFIEISISGSRGNFELSPDNYDIREISIILENAENLLFPGDKKDRPVISYQIQKGSVKHIFKTSIQAIIGFNAILGAVNDSKNIDFLDVKTATAMESLQHMASRKDYTVKLATSLDQTNKMQLDKTTRFYRTEAVWADAEFYFYGKVTNAGGKEKANIHLLTDELGILTIETPKSFLEKYEENLLYKAFGIRATGKQHSKTGEVDKSTLRFIELIDYDRTYDEQYLNVLRKRAKSWIAAIDPESWLNEIRGEYEA